MLKQRVPHCGSGSGGCGSQGVICYATERRANPHRPCDRAGDRVSWAARLTTISFVKRYRRKTAGQAGAAGQAMKSREAGCAAAGRRDQGRQQLARRSKRSLQSAATATTAIDRPMRRPTLLVMPSMEMLAVAALMEAMADACPLFTSSMSNLVWSAELASTHALNSSARPCGVGCHGHGRGAGLGRSGGGVGPQHTRRGSSEKLLRAVGRTDQKPGSFAAAGASSQPCP